MTQPFPNAEAVDVPTLGDQPRFATDATTAGPPDWSAEAESTEPELFLGHFRARHQRTRETRDFWCVVANVRNQVIHLADYEVDDQRFDYASDPAVTETLSEDPWHQFSRSMEVGPVRQQEVESLRGTLALSLGHKVLFSQEVEVEIEQLPRLQPRVVLGRRVLEADNE